MVENGTLVGLSHSDSVLESVHQFNTGQRGFHYSREANSPKLFVDSEVNCTEIKKELAIEPIRQYDFSGITSELLQH